MKLIAPNRVLENKVQWKVSDRTKAIVEYFAEYTGYDEDESWMSF